MPHLELLITSAHCSRDEIGQQITEASVKEPDEDGRQFLHVLYADGRRWVLPLDSCPTWTEFVAHFFSSDEEFDQNYVVTYKKNIQGPKEWQSLHTLARRRSIKVRIRPRREWQRQQGASPPAQIYAHAHEQSGGSSSEAMSSTSYATKVTADGASSVRLPPVSTGAKEARAKRDGSNADRDLASRQTSEQPEQRRSTNGRVYTPNDLVSRSKETFHLFFWQAVVPRSSKTDSTSGEQRTQDAPRGQPDQTNDGKTFDTSLTHSSHLAMQIESIVEQYLKTGKRNAEARPTQCTQRTLEDVQTKLVEIKRLATAASANQPRESRHYRRRTEGYRDADGNKGDVSISREIKSPTNEAEQIYSRCEKIVSLAKQIFQFLLPLNYTSVSSSTYWGLVYWYLQNPEAEGSISIQNYAQRSNLQRQLRRLADDFRYGPHPGSITIPNDINKAWHHMVSIFVLGTAKSPRKMLRNEFYWGNKSLNSGRTQFFRSLQGDKLESMEAVLPYGLISLMISKFMKDITEAAPDIIATYYDFILRLEQEVQRRPYNRAHQEKLSAYRQEISCILRVLEEQSDIVNQLHQKFVGDAYNISDFGRKREDLILEECLTMTEDRIANFNSLERHARDLASFNLLRIESSKDRQEASILVFTVVTIIFLPLSFVSSFFGMNTTDIRDTKFPQWVFWVSALPLTILVVITSLFVAYKMEPVKDLWHRAQDKWSAHCEPRTELYKRPGVGSERTNSHYNFEKIQVAGVPDARATHNESERTYARIPTRTEPNVVLLSPGGLQRRDAAIDHAGWKKYGQRSRIYRGSPHVPDDEGMQKTPSD
ncbi:MAG: hypothetical protein Q9209_005431 [Squamulea sp. 1 TL-2023]